LLAQSVLETYNDANALNTAGVCDTQYHSLTSIQVVATLSNIDGVLDTSRRRHLSGFNFNRDFIFRIRGRCRGCPSSTPLFNDAVSSGRRHLALHHHEATRNNLSKPDEASTATVNLLHTQIDDAEFQFNDAQHRHLPVLNGQCYCQAITKSRRIPTKGEVIQALNDRFEVIGPQGAGVVTIASTVQNIVQVVPVNCSFQVNNFTAKVKVDIRTSKTISSNELSRLGAAFRTTYNDLTAKYCDPLFRAVESVQTIYGRRQLTEVTPVESGHRGLQQRLVAVHFVVQARCRGCSGSTSLFFSATRRSLGRSNDGYLSVDPSIQSSEEPSTDSTPSRVLPQTTGAQCYCSTNSIASTAPAIKAFQAAFNQSVTALDRSLAIYSISEVY